MGEEEKKMQPWTVSIKDGILTCVIDLRVPDSITMGLGVADRIKSLLFSIEQKRMMEKQMEEMTKGIIVPKIFHPNGNGPEAA